jgi:Uma2 family endonuclease
MPTGRKPGRVAGRIHRSLDDYADVSGRGAAYPDHVGFTVPWLTSGRQSVAPGASFFTGPFPANPLRFLQGPPSLAVEVRSEHDYGPAAESELAAQRADSFEAGTEIVWDVDPVAERIAVHRSAAPDQPVISLRGQELDAEPLLPRWRLAVDWIFS